ncbi:DUF1214 domain-containing protein [Rhizobium sp. KVB221]|uniref:DUF1214 domain-containing protein n=1 Tax=Rhizobium setariae TaxID=2801340 RepID=A0A937CND0_9HYPH|nr:DUF1214 domain-containing protein [Rhizobium setariae]MBL0371048.1 DUF1214 domain-containing protein [Rhizobium setariae]
MFRLPLLVALALLTAFGLGIGSAVMMLNASSGFGSIRIGPWAAFPQAQTAAADPYAQSHRARAGRLLFGSAEGLMFQADVDDDGRRLSASCTYEMSGQTPPARFWTLFAANSENEPLDPGDDLPSAFNAWNVLRQADGSFRIQISANAQPGNWLAVRRGRPFRLVLALLDTPTAGSSGVLDIAMPSIRKVGCP